MLFSLFVHGEMDIVVEKKFPSENLVPKNETGVVNFLKKYPTYNGEGITIAIFDSGVDPKSAGLRVSTYIKMVKLRRKYFGKRK